MIAIMNRRLFSKMIAAAAVTGVSAQEAGKKEGKPFGMCFGPHPGMLHGAPKDYVDSLKFAHDLGFRGWEDNGLGARDAKTQERIGEFVRNHDFKLGVMVISNGHGMAFSKPDEGTVAKILDEMKHAVEVSKRTGQTHMTMIPGARIKGVPLDEQIMGAVDLMKRCCDVVEEHGVIMVLEPLSHPMAKQPVLLESFEDGFKLCELVNRKSCKVLADFFHEGEIGNGAKLIENAEKAWSQIAYVQYGDSPGRKEPGTGRLDLKAVTKWLHEKGYEGVIGMEHGVSRKGQEGLDELMASYRAIDVG